MDYVDLPTKQEGVAVWILLIVLLIGFIVLLLVYFSTRSYLIDPENCFKTNAEYSVLTGKEGDVLNQCPGIGVNPQSSECIFETTSLYSAIQLCNSNPTTCQAFTFDGSVVQFLQTPLLGATDPSSIVYTNNFV